MANQRTTANVPLLISFTAKNATLIFLQLLAARKRPKEAARIQGKAVEAVVVHSLLRAILHLLLPLHVAEVVEVVEIAEALTVEEERAAVEMVDGNLQIFQLLTILQETKRASCRSNGSFALFTTIPTSS